MTTALITGITGQDGSYLAELLLAKGYSVIGTTRDMATALNQLPSSLHGNVQLVTWNMQDQNSITDVLSRYRPNELYNYAAYSSGEGMFDDPVGIGEVNGLAVARILDAIRKIDPNIRFCQASSREIFGEPKESPQTEMTECCPRSPYGAAKLYADSMIRIYRQRYGLYACSAILYNHESPRRGLGFVTRKISMEAAKIKRGMSNKLLLGNLDTCRDWGFAGDYVYAMWQMLQQNEPSDFVIATGEAHSVREFCECAFEYLGLDYIDYVKEDSFAFRPSEVIQLVGNADKARRLLNWESRVGFGELVSMMVEADLKILDGKITGK
jgi:GDPmannose 4,6-dehydratase